MLVKYQDGLRGLLRECEVRENEIVASRETVKLPVVLKSGEVWKGYSAITEHSPMHMNKTSLILAERLFYKVKILSHGQLAFMQCDPSKYPRRIRSGAGVPYDFRVSYCFSASTMSHTHF